MRALSESRTRVDCLKDQHEVAEIAKFAAKFGYHFTLSPSTENSMYESVMTRTAETFLRDDLAQLVYLTAIADNESVEKVLDGVRRKLSDHHHIALDVPPSDQAGIGELHPDGHGDR
jgi:hypothetical protein